MQSDGIAVEVTPVSSDQTTVTIDLFASDDPAPRCIDDPGSRQVGQVVVDITDPSDAHPRNDASYGAPPSTEINST
ncbi:hypothetical protein ABZ208_36890 [Streptomyces sp. NPDC006208]|uniref:hypothetical protein n=1 Tax=Streptomyces sp. NPDC006208 TaxID=3156734 RepID=UPI0033A3108A